MFLFSNALRFTEEVGTVSVGLAPVKCVIDIMQGEIAVERAVGIGTTFTVKIRRI